ncbi:hypothetical protein ElyMa_006829300 [Elysia marginata]|uniref:O-methyltransferase domain-containing protein n=1 Tax=Elysia marginata TaxID=1093978 RepID=A0AAV4J6W2_9GAST|nr:hypothetical protein ElyMa_006829300 [Elysia marginata]
MEKSEDYAATIAHLDSVIKQKNGHQIAENGLYGYLKMAYADSYSDNFLETARPKLHDARFQIWDDPVFSSLETDDIIKLILDTVCDNVPSTLNILEAGAIQSTFFRCAFPKALDHFTFRSSNYHVADRFIVEDAISYPIKRLLFNTDDPSSFPDEHRESFELLILKNHLHAHKDLDLAMTKYSEMVKPGGFVLVMEPVER